MHTVSKTHSFWLNFLFLSQLDNKNNNSLTFFGKIEKEVISRRTRSRVLTIREALEVVSYVVYIGGVIIKYIKLLGLIISVIVINIIVLSPGFLGVELGGSPLHTAIGVTILFVSVLSLLYGSYVWLFKPPVALPLKQIKTQEDYAEALSQYRKVKVLEKDIALALKQLERIEKKKETLLEILNQRFESTELSYIKFISVTQEVEKLFYLNLKSILNRLLVFDESEYESVISQKPTQLSPRILQERTMVYNEFMAFIQNSLATNEEILLKLDKLILEISRLDSLEPGDIEGMPCIQEIDSLIKQTKYYKQ
ncbi:hypothetical protein ACT8ZS_33225 [Paenibacillus sp. M.A.Huq-84]